MNMYRDHLARLIKNQRVKEGFTQHELARVCEISRVKLSHVERGLSLPSADLIIKISGPLNISVQHLLIYAVCAALNEPDAGETMLKEITSALRKLNVKQLAGEDEDN